MIVHLGMFLELWQQLLHFILTQLIHFRLNVEHVLRKGRVSHHPHNKKWSAVGHFTAWKTVYTTRKAGERVNCAWEEFYAIIFLFLSPIQLWNLDHFFLPNVVIMMITDCENFFHHDFYCFVTLSLYHLRVVGWQKKL